MAKDSSNKVVNVPPLRFPEFTGTWEMCTLKNIIRIQGGYAFQSDKFQSDGIPIIRISNLPQLSNIVDLSDCVYYEDGNYENYIVAYGDLLIAMSGATTGKTAVYLENTKAFLNQRVGLFRAKSPKLYYSFLYPFIESNIFINQLHEKLVAGAQPNISSKDIEEIKLYLPAPLEQQKIALFFAAIDERIATQSKIIDKLQSLMCGICERLLYSDTGENVKLGDILSERIEKTTQNNQYEILSSTVKGIFLQREYFSKDIASENNIGYKIVRLNDVVLSPQNLWMGNINFNDKFQIGAVSPSYKIFTIAERFYKPFIAAVLKTHRALYNYELVSGQVLSAAT